jgi:hypothetical protein
VAVELEPTLASLYRERSRVHFEHHDDQAALADINQAIRHDPQGKPAEDDHAVRRRILQRMNAEPDELGSPSLHPGRNPVDRG